MRDDVQVFNVRDLLVESGEFVEMGGEEAEGMDLRCDVSDYAARLVISYGDAMLIRLFWLTLRLPKLGQNRRTSRCLH